MQTGVTAQELRSYELRVDLRKTANRANETWRILEDRWEAQVESARMTVTAYQRGKPANRHSISAARHLVQVADNRPAWEVIRTVLAMFLLQGDQPRRFLSDRAFDTQLVRRFIRLATVNAGVYVDHKTNKVKRVYRDLPPRVIRAIAMTLKATLGGAGVTLAAKEREDAQRTLDERKRLADALGELQ